MLAGLISWAVRRRYAAVLLTLLFAAPLWIRAAVPSRFPRGLSRDPVGIIAFIGEVNRDFHTLFDPRAQPTAPASTHAPDRCGNARRGGDRPSR